MDHQADGRPLRNGQRHRSGANVDALVAHQAPAFLRLLRVTSCTCLAHRHPGVGALLLYAGGVEREESSRAVEDRN